MQVRGLATRHSVERKRAEVDRTSVSKIPYSVGRLGRVRNGIRIFFLCQPRLRQPRLCNEPQYCAVLRYEVIAHILRYGDIVWRAAAPHRRPMKMPMA